MTPSTHPTPKGCATRCPCVTALTRPWPAWHVAAQCRLVRTKGHTTRVCAGLRPCSRASRLACCHLTSLASAAITRCRSSRRRVVAAHQRHACSDRGRFHRRLAQQVRNRHTPLFSRQRRLLTVCRARDVPALGLNTTRANSALSQHLMAAAASGALQPHRVPSAADLQRDPRPHPRRVPGPQEGSGPCPHAHQLAADADRSVRGGAPGPSARPTALSAPGTGRCRCRLPVARAPPP